MRGDEMRGDERRGDERRGEEITAGLLVFGPAESLPLDS